VLTALLEFSCAAFEYIKLFKYASSSSQSSNQQKQGI
jgi:hypothetical protein